MILCNQCGQPVSGDTNVCLDCFTLPAAESSFDRPAFPPHPDRVKNGGNGNGGSGRAGALQTAVAEFAHGDDAPTIVAGAREFERPEQVRPGVTPTNWERLATNWKRGAIALTVISLALVVGLIASLVKLNDTQSSLGDEQSKRRGLAGSKSELERTVASLEEKLATTERELQKSRDGRKTLAERWPLTVTELKLLNGSDSASATELPYTISSANTRFVYWRATLQNIGEEPLSGYICVKYINPLGSFYTYSASTPSCTNLKSIELPDRATVMNEGFGNVGVNSFSLGLNRVELWWDGRKIGERAFYVY